MMPPPKDKVLFLFDCVSPYSALGFHVLRKYTKIWDLALEARPIFLGGIMVESQNKPPALQSPAKVPYLAADVRRNAAMFDYPMLDTPPNFFSEAAKKVLQIQRLLTGLQLDGAIKSEERYFDVISGFFSGIHQRKEFRNPETNDLIINDEMIMKVLMESGAFPDAQSARRAISRANDADVKARLTENTKKAAEMGMFGAPTFIVSAADRSLPMFREEESHLIFGSDRFEQMAFILNKKYMGVNPKL